ncbi:poly-beta-hydroxybutyrate polymerase [Variibacter gotjawalensis]|uniref:Poly-beta-hydroxybutyrate polymerase n=1 Tax=Variibacter gotjawalensis TaxID=1333996 RepID=A0A0S3PZL7_9BRAD|nr:alpha/beta fold hydrolase [Variibacter gotjawalensis]NIK47202.1 polyhydroxyalkanoate synthase [Variibacter gotjawalensis]RZS49102.1 polyhydroxyalkanoate synthase [Variibacter gotjawalensis]BAT61364.1 poly-beta-hydroxybutyrate polymerase [Variibacter gotjawalensis]
MSTAQKQKPDDSIASRIQAEVDRAIQRNIKGLEYFTSPAPAVGLTPKDVMVTRGTMTLYHYRPMAKEVYRKPLLIVMATSNRGYILDLAPGQSFIEFLLKQGYDVYVLDWNPPTADEKHLRFEDYVLDFIPDAVQRVLKESGQPDLNMIGYCMGGVLSTWYAALHADGPLQNLVCFTTPVDFRHMKLFNNWSDKRHFDVDKLVERLGNVPPEFIYASFDMLRPASRVTAQISLWENMWSDQYVKSYRMLDRWSNETLPLAGEYFKQTVKELMWENSFYKNELVIGGRRVDLGNIKVPLLHVLAEHDHIVPYEAAKPLVAHVGSEEKEEVVLKGGHVSLVAGGNAMKRLWPKVDNWLGERSV